MVLTFHYMTNKWNNSMKFMALCITYYICNKINRPHKPEGLSSFDIPLNQVQLLSNFHVPTL